jgi:hypothetical protein
MARYIVTHTLSEHCGRTELATAVEADHATGEVRWLCRANDGAVWWAYPDNPLLREDAGPNAPVMPLRNLCLSLRHTNTWRAAA